MRIKFIETFSCQSGAFLKGKSYDVSPAIAGETKRIGVAQDTNEPPDKPKRNPETESPAMTVESATIVPLPKSLTLPATPATTPATTTAPTTAATAMPATATRKRKGK